MYLFVYVFIHLFIPHTKKGAFPGHSVNHFLTPNSKALPLRHGSRWPAVKGRGLEGGKPRWDQCLEDHPNPRYRKWLGSPPFTNHETAILERVPQPDP